ncbi:hypothetical protein LIER_17171 [Lithospermum erythrorhizon]|uniref:Auxin-responsive protein n=1 Tax=Lithospermum erythrorhizon TaxID=34254 RepID=A0AAV3QCL3_LITER
MSPPMLDLEMETRMDLSALISSETPDCISQNGLRLKEHNYLGLSDISSVGSSGVSAVFEESKSNLNLKATELRLGLPGSQSPERDLDISLSSEIKLDEKPFFPLVSLKDGISTYQKPIVSGNKRGFSDTVDEYSGLKSSLYKGNCRFPVMGSDPETPKSLAQGNGTGDASIKALLPIRSPGTQSSFTKDLTNKVAHELPNTTSETELAKINCCSTNSSPDAKAQVVGWPPIRSFRKNTLATTSKNNDEVNCKLGPGGLFIKVSMDGAPYLRKVDLRTYSNYQELSSALEKMFSCFTIGQCGSQGAPGGEISERNLQDLLNGSEYVLTYEDKDGDWMLVGDVPWEMFIDSCKKLKIMKGSDAIGLAPRAMEKSRSRN